MLSELQLLIAKEADLQSKIAKIENGDPDALYIDRVVEMRAPKSSNSKRNWKPCAVSVMT